MLYIGRMKNPWYLNEIIQKDAFKSRKMAFISGPRQVGKTTLGKQLLTYVSLFFLSFVSLAGADECKIWFKKSGLEPGADCLMRCVSADTDMGTFHCSNACDSLCKETVKQKFIFKTSVLYPNMI